MATPPAPAQAGRWEKYLGDAIPAFLRGNYIEAEKQLGAALKTAEGLGPEGPRLAASLYPHTPGARTRRTLAASVPRLSSGF